MRDGGKEWREGVGRGEEERASVAGEGVGRGRGNGMGPRGLGSEILYLDVEGRELQRSSGVVRGWKQAGAVAPDKSGMHTLSRWMPACLCIGMCVSREKRSAYKDCVSCEAGVQKDAEWGRGWGDMTLCHTSRALGRGSRGLEDAAAAAVMSYMMQASSVEPSNMHAENSQAQAVLRD